MKILESKILNEKVVIAEAPEEFQQSSEKALELKCALYTKKEAAYLAEVTATMSADEREAHIKLVNNIKKMFEGFVRVPKNWRSANG